MTRARVASRDHDQAAAIFAVDDDAGEGEHQHGGDRLQNGQGAEGDFGVRGLQNVPGDGGRVHAAAQHGDQIGAEDETQRPLLQNGTHTLLLYEKCAPVECASRVFASGFDRGEWAAAQGETGGRSFAGRPISENKNTAKMSSSGSIGWR
jgi:hypothetical protein